MEQVYVDMLITAVASFLAASGGFWVYLRRRVSAKDATTRLLMGLAHDKILTYGMQYIRAGSITRDQYEDLRVYLYDPYVELGGNGTAERIMHLVDRLPFDETSPIIEVARSTTIRATDRTANEGIPKDVDPRRRSTD